VIAFKFLLPDRRAPFSGKAWPEDGWLEVAGPLVPCRNGVHGCRPRDLANWLGDDLWEVRLDGEIIEHDLSVVARRGRLTRRIDAWDDEARWELALHCARRAAHHAATELERAGLADAAARLAAADDPAAIGSAARAGAAAAFEQAALSAERLAAYAGDAAEWAETEPPSVIAFIAAHVAGRRSPPGEADRFRAERAEQGRWLADRLGLAAGG
jgi:hypothetical protein